MAAQMEKIRCSDCNEVLLLKNLKAHYARNHVGNKLRYTSISSKNMLDLFRKRDPVAASTDAQHFSDDTGTNPIPKDNSDKVDTTNNAPACKRARTEQDIVDGNVLQQLLETVTSKYLFSVPLAF